MKPEDYMPFFGNKFLEACAGYGPLVQIAYLKCLWHYWNHTKCQGLPDDDSYLKNVAQCPDDTWNYVRTIIFDRKDFFVQNGDGKWHQKFAADLFQSQVRKWEGRQDQTRAARAARWVKPVTQPVTENATERLTPTQEITFREELNRIMARMSLISGTYGGHQTWREDDRQEFSRLKARRNELRGKLGVMV